MEHITLKVDVYFDRGIEAVDLDQFIDSLNRVLETEMADGELVFEEASVLDYEIELVNYDED